MYNIYKASYNLHTVKQSSSRMKKEWLIYTYLYCKGISKHKHIFQDETLSDISDSAHPRYNAASQSSWQTKTWMTGPHGQGASSALICPDKVSYLCKSLTLLPVQMNKSIYIYMYMLTLPSIAALCTIMESKSTKRNFHFINCYHL